MHTSETFHASRRSTRVPLKVVVAILAVDEIPTCDGETITVSIHGALIATAVQLSKGMKLWIHVYLTDKRAAAHVVYVDPSEPLQCAIELDEPQNIWGVPLTPADWGERES